MIKNRHMLASLHFYVIDVCLGIDSDTTYPFCKLNIYALLRMFNLLTHVYSPYIEMSCSAIACYKKCSHKQGTLSMQIAHHAHDP